ncbi:hypothetical protein ACLI4U_19140 (plasmid) [Natrialbaceae archaeon A-CW2]
MSQFTKTVTMFTFFFALSAVTVYIAIPPFRGAALSLPGAVLGSEAGRLLLFVIVTFIGGVILIERAFE